jgi:hypothetical protein
VHLVAFTVEIYYDARSYKRRICNTKYLETYVFEYLLIFQNALHSPSKSNCKKGGLRHALGACEEIQM